VVDRLSSTDCAELAFDVGPQPRVVGAVVELAGPSVSVEEVRAILAGAAAGSPLLGRRIRRVPLGCGRPVWAPASPDLAVHVRAARCSDDGDDLLDLAARVARVPLPKGRPLWRLVVVTRPSGASALIWLSHHACGDGPMVLAELLRVLGPAESATVAGRPGVRPRPAAWPTNEELALDALSTRVRAMARWRSGLTTLRAAARELAAMRTPVAPRTPFNVPVGPDLRFATCTVPLAALADGARACGATVNDALLCATGAAVGAELDRIGEPRDHLVATVAATFGSRRANDRPRNEVGGMLVPIPADRHHHVTTRLREVAAATRNRKEHLSAAVPTTLSPVMRAMAAAQVYGWVMRRQRVVNVAVSNLRGPAEPPVLCGREVTRIAPFGALLGNVPIDVLALSTGDDLVVTVCLTGFLARSASTLAASLSAELGGIAALAGNRRGTTLVG
jgi:diacylglycerol O-acyltransferase / wax synthase